MFGSLLHPFVLFYSGLFVITLSYVIAIIILMPICSLIKEGLGLGLNGWEGGEDLGGIGRETVIKIYCMK